MGIQAINGFNGVANLGFANLASNFNNLAITMLATNILSNLPGAYARDAHEAACEVMCSPLPGGPEDAPEQTCQKVCKEGAKIVSETTWREKCADGVCTMMGFAGKAATPLFEAGECLAICYPIGGVIKGVVAVGKSLVEAGGKYLSGDTLGGSLETAKAAGKATCVAIAHSPAGPQTCLLACGGLKFVGLA